MQPNIDANHACPSSPTRLLTRFLLSGPTNSELTKPNPASAWLTDKSWVEVLNLSTLPAFAGFSEHFTHNIQHYKGLFDSNESHEYPMAEPFESQLTSFQRLAFLRYAKGDELIGVNGHHNSLSYRRQCDVSLSITNRICVKFCLGDTPTAQVLTMDSQESANGSQWCVHINAQLWCHIFGEVLQLKTAKPVYEAKWHLSTDL